MSLHMQLWRWYRQMIMSTTDEHTVDAGTMTVTSGQPTLTRTHRKPVSAGTIMFEPGETTARAQDDETISFTIEPARIDVEGCE